jgi:hypothetical protein
VAVRHATYYRRWLEQTGVDWPALSTGAQRVPHLPASIMSVPPSSGVSTSMAMPRSASDLLFNLLENCARQQTVVLHESSQARARNPQLPRGARHAPASVHKRLLDGLGGNCWRHHRGNFPARKSLKTSRRSTIFARRSAIVSHNRLSMTRPGRGLRRAGPSSISLRNSSIRRSHAVARCSGEP